ncbi:MAG: HAD-IA family hydrolase [Deltaproteobacteria bacterium]|nr:HAD-IA family hydrolase [Deltaproteobacteria bacterium]
MAIKVVFFDAAGTLIKPVRKVGESYAVTAAKYGVQVAPAELNGRFQVTFGRAAPLAFPNADHSTIDQLERDWWKTLVRQVFEPWEPFERFDDFFDDLFDYFSQPQAWTLFPEVLETLSALKRRGMTLAVISNFDSRLIKILHGLDTTEWFEEIYVSSRVGYAKPDRRIFELALRNHGLNAENAAHVGDSEENDWRGANAAGLKGLLVDRSQNPSRAEGRISDLQQILEHLD